MILFHVDEESAEKVDAHIAGLRDRVLGSIRVGMKESMEVLARAEADKLHGSPIVGHTGKLEQAVLASPKVTETDTVIRGDVSSFVDGKPLGAWLEDGTSIPAVVGKVIDFTAADVGKVFAHGHRAFHVKAHPFQIPTLEESKQAIFDTIQARIGEAMAE